MDYRKPELKNLPKVEADYRKRMKPGKHSKKDGWKETEELMFRPYGEPTEYQQSEDFVSEWNRKFIENLKKRKDQTT